MAEPPESSAKRPTPASLKRVTADNLARLGAERLAEILVETAAKRPELKRRLRMELAAEQGAEHLELEIDKWLASLGASRSRVSWRKRSSFVRDLAVLRDLIAERLAGLDAASALARMWQFLELARRLDSRVRDRDGELAATFRSAAADLGGLVARTGGADVAARAFVDAAVRDPLRWALWTPDLLAAASPAFAAAALGQLRTRDVGPALAQIFRQLADASADPEAFEASFGAEALKTPSIAAEVARRWLDAGQTEAAGRVLGLARTPAKARRWPRRADEPAEIDFDWETVWIDWLEASRQAAEAQAARWASFERTLSADRAKAFARRLPDFEDVEAEGRAFEVAACHPDFVGGLKFLLDWPALHQAAAMIAARADEAQVDPEDAEAWAARLQARQPKAAHTLLRKAAAAAFRRRDFATCDRLTQLAEAIGLDTA